MARKPSDPPKKPKRPHGRSLEDFYFEGKEGKARLHPAEWQLLDAARTGEWAIINPTRPNEATDDNRMRGAFLRFIALGGDEDNPVHEKGVRLRGAWIEGECDLQGATLEQDFGISNSVFVETLALRGAEARTINLGGSECRGGLSGDRLQAKGGVFLRNGFHAKGEVRLLGARIGSDLNCNSGHFENEKGRALSCQAAVIAGGFQFRNIQTFSGIRDCTKMRCGTLVDDAGSWAKVGENNYYLDGFDYTFLIQNPPRKAADLVRWLKGDIKNLAHGCYPQPWKHLIAVLRRQGENDKADIVAMELREQQRLQRPKDDILRYVLWFWRKLAGYGYRPMRLFYAMMVVCFCCGVFFQIARDYGLFAPSNPLVFANEKYASCRPENGKPWALEDEGFKGNWAKCADGPLEYTAFNPYLYSLDLILPLVDLQQDKDWAPMVLLPESWLKRTGEARTGATDRTWWGHAVRWLLWFEIIFGWVVSLLFVAILSGLARHEKEE